MRRKLLLALAATVSAASPPTAGARPQLSSVSSTRHHHDHHLWAQRAEEQPPSSAVGETVLQIVNNVAGAGILTLSAGMAGGVGSIPAMLLCLGMGAISGYTFYILGEACELTGETTFKGLWSRALGASTTWVVDLSIALMCLSAATIYSGILGDVITQMLALMRVPAGMNVRGANIIAITLTALVPLSLLQVREAQRCAAARLAAASRTVARAPPPARRRPCAALRAATFLSCAVRAP
eukprot:666626-Prymnesium_polylepis.1